MHITIRLLKVSITFRIGENDRSVRPRLSSTADRQSRRINNNDNNNSTYYYRFAYNCIRTNVDMSDDKLIYV